MHVKCFICVIMNIGTGIRKEIVAVVDVKRI